MQDGVAHHQIETRIREKGKRLASASKNLTRVANAIFGIHGTWIRRRSDVCFVVLPAIASRIMLGERSTPINVQPGSLGENLWSI